MHRSLVLLALLLAAPLRLAQQSAPPAPAAPAEKLLLDASRRLRVLHGLRYDANATRHFLLANQTWRVQGSVTLGWRARQVAPLARIEARITDPGAAKPVEVVLLGAGGHWTVLDRAARTWCRAPTPAQLGQRGQLALELVPAQILGSSAWWPAGEPAPVLGESVQLGPQSCRELRWKSRDGLESASWLIASEDGLPRVIESRSELPGQETTTRRLTLTTLALDPSFLRDPFELPIPEGFRQIEPEAPASQPAAPPPGASSLISLASSLEPLRAAFEAAAGKPRVIGLFAPS